MLISRRRPWNRQPDIVAEPIKTGPLSNPALLWNAATPRLNLANGATPTGDGTGVSERGGPYGKEIDFSGTGTGRLIFPTAAEQDSVTFVVQARLDSTAANDRFLSCYNGVGFGIYDFYYDGIAGRWVFSVTRATTTSQFRLSSGLGTAFSGVLVLTYEFGGTPTAFFNGGAVSTVTTVAGSGALVASSNLLGIGGRPDATDRQCDGGIVTVARYDWAIPDSLAQELSRANALPGALYAPRRIWVPVSAPAVPTLSAAEGISITSSGFTPRVTYAY